MTKRDLLQFIRYWAKEDNICKLNTIQQKMISDLKKNFRTEDDALQKVLETESLSSTDIGGGIKVFICKNNLVDKFRGILLTKLENKNEKDDRDIVKIFILKNNRYPYMTKDDVYENEMYLKYINIEQYERKKYICFTNKRQEDINAYETNLLVEFIQSENRLPLSYRSNNSSELEKCYSKIYECRDKDVKTKLLELGIDFETIKHNNKKPIWDEAVNKNLILLEEFIEKFNRFPTTYDAYLYNAEFKSFVLYNRLNKLQYLRDKYPEIDKNTEEFKKVNKLDVKKKP